MHESKRIRESCKSSPFLVQDQEAEKVQKQRWTKIRAEMCINVHVVASARTLLLILSLIYGPKLRPLVRLHNDNTSSQSIR